jgi:ADP-heptose:LPS heptosyltransferase
VVASNSHLDEIIVCEFPGFTRRPKTSILAPYRTLWDWAERLRARRFDLALVLRFDHWWGALLAYVAAIPNRVGYAIPECEPFLTKAVPYAGHRHEVRQNLTLVEQVVEGKLSEALSPAPQPESRVSFSGRDADHPEARLECFAPIGFKVLSEDREWFTRYLTQRGVTPKQDLVAIHPGAGASVKLWLPAAWALVANELVERWPVHIVITGSREELDLGWAVYAHMDSEATVAAGDTTLGQLAALFERCRLVIGPDCGPLHLAVATGTPTVHLYGPVDVAKFGPWGDPNRHRALTSDRECVPCGHLDYLEQELPDHPCVREITVEMVSEAAQGLLARA